MPRSQGLVNFESPPILRAELSACCSLIFKVLICCRVKLQEILGVISASQQCSAAGPHLQARGGRPGGNCLMLWQADMNTVSGSLAWLPPDTCYCQDDETLHQHYTTKTTKLGTCQNWLFPLFSGHERFLLIRWGWGCLIPVSPGSLSLVSLGRGGGGWTKNFPLKFPPLRPESNTICLSGLWTGRELKEVFQKFELFPTTREVLVYWGYNV